jgi:hypothetical protein
VRPITLFPGTFRSSRKPQTDRPISGCFSK